MGPSIQWVPNYITGDKIYRVSVAPDEEAVRKHVQQGGFPANRSSRVHSMNDSTTAEQRRRDPRSARRGGAGPRGCPPNPLGRRG